MQTLREDGHSARHRHESPRLSLRDDAEAATGFTIYVDQLAEATNSLESRPLVYLAEGYDKSKAVQLRAKGYRTIAQIGDGEDALALGCTYCLNGSELSEL